MPSLVGYAEIKAALVADVAAAWPSVRTIHVGPMRAPEREPGFAVIDLDPVRHEWETVRDTLAYYRWTVYGVFRLPGATTHPLDEAVDRLDALAVLLEDSSLYAGVGMLPTVTELDPSADLAHELEGVYTVRLVFETRVRSPHGT